MQAHLYDFHSEWRSFSQETLNLYRSFGRIGRIAFKALKQILAGVAYMMITEPRLYKRIDPGRKEIARHEGNDYLGMHPPSWQRGI